VLLRQRGVVALESVRLDELQERVYNFHVAELQNYAVGGCGVLVHNTNDPPAQSGRPTKLDPDPMADTNPDINLGPPPPEPPGPGGGGGWWGPWNQPPGSSPPGPGYTWNQKFGGWEAPPGSNLPWIIKRTHPMR
jgi:hypothetical protein